MPCKALGEGLGAKKPWWFVCHVKPLGRAFRGTQACGQLCLMGPSFLQSFLPGALPYTDNI